LPKPEPGLKKILYLLEIAPGLQNVHWKINEGLVGTNVNT